jgi:hypothetical protein
MANIRPESVIRNADSRAADSGRPSGRLSLFEATWLERVYPADADVRISATDVGRRIADQETSDA